MRRAAAAALATAALLAGCGGSENADRPSRLTVGEGRTGATVFVPPGGARGRVGVVFLHGWGATLPRTYGPWIEHLVARGHVVIHPRYQDSALDPPPQALPSAVIGVRSALARVRGLRSLVVVGHSAGGALAADLAAVAPSAGIPRPRAVLSLYAGRSLRGVPARLPAADLETIPSTTRVVAYAGADDRVVGTTTARAIARRTGGRYVLVRDPAADDHLAPQRATPTSRRIFWRALDTLIGA